jgi:hypothetical protein
MITEFRHPRLKELTGYLTQVRSDLLDRLDGGGELMERRRGPESWSVAEIVGHLYLVEQSVTTRIESGLRDLRAAAEETECDSVMHVLDRFRITEVIKPVEAPEFLRPRAISSPGELRASLASSRTALFEILRAADGRALGAVTSPHPRLGDLTLYQWILFLGQHEERHIRQIDCLLTAS